MTPPCVLKHDLPALLFLASLSTSTHHSLFFPHGEMRGKTSSPMLSTAWQCSFSNVFSANLRVFNYLLTHLQRAQPSRRISRIMSLNYLVFFPPVFFSVATLNLIQVQMHWMIRDRLWLITDIIFKLICKFPLTAEE